MREFSYPYNRRDESVVNRGEEKKENFSPTTTAKSPSPQPSPV